MHLHLTIGGRWVDCIPLDPVLGRNKIYIETMKEVLKKRNLDMLRRSRVEGEFYIDPKYDEAVHLSPNNR